MRQSDDIPAQSRTSSKAKRRSKPRGSYTDRDIGDAFESAKAELIKLADLSPAFDQDDRKTYNKLHADFQAVRTRYQSLDFDEAEGSQQHFLRRLLFWRSTPKNVDFNKLVYELDGLRAWIITASADVETKLHRKNQTSLGDAFQSLTQRMLQEFDDKSPDMSRGEFIGTVVRAQAVKELGSARNVELFMMLFSQSLHEYEEQKDIPSTAGYARIPERSEVN